MTTPSGQIKFSDVNSELGSANNSQLKLSDTNLRRLFGQTTGPVNMGTGRNKNKNIIAIGGTIITTGGYRYHIFTGSDVFGLIGLTANPVLEALLVGGGGGAGGKRGSGGGGGGVSVTSISSASLSIGNHALIVGGGGAGTGDVFSQAGTGGSTTLFSPQGVTLAINGGGGGGGGSSGSSGYGAVPNGSGAGGRWLEQGGNFTTSPGFGNGTGGNGGGYSGYGGGGGGGSGNHDGGGGPSGAGGVGNSTWADWCTIAGFTTAPGAGGAGGAGYGGGPSIAGSPNTGNGAIGAGDNAGWYGAGGGSGFAIIRYQYF